jgi:hypothetical protein
MTHANNAADAGAQRIRPRDRDAVLQSLRAGVVPRTGHQHIQVGRSREVQALVADITRIADGGAGSRFIIGDYGSGKTFFLHVVRAIALQSKLVTMHADLSPDRRLHADAVRWLRGEYSTRTDARAALGVRTIVDDANFYDQLKLLARFVTMAGYTGLLVCLDEMVNLYKLANTQARNANYEQILRIVNDSMQGTAAHLGFLFGGTPEFLTDTRRGLYSYTALQSRLAENTFAAGGLIDTSGPVLRLASLTQEDFYILLTKLRTLYAAGSEQPYLLPDEAIVAFMQHCAARIGEAYFRTPRTTIKAFLDLLAVLAQNPDQDWRQLVGAVDVEPDTNPDLDPIDTDTNTDTDAVAGTGIAAPVTPIGGHHGDANKPDDDDELRAFRL